MSEVEEAEEQKANQVAPENQLMRLDFEQNLFPDEGDQEEGPVSSSEGSFAEENEGAKIAAL